MRIVGPISSGLATGGAGAAGANADSVGIITGYVMGIYVKYNDSPPAGTTDVVVKTQGTAPNAPSLTLLSLANAAADGWFFPRVQYHTTAGAAVASAYDWPPVHDKVNVAIAQANDGDSVDVWLLVD